MDPQQPVIAVVGLWHLGSVTAACLAEAGFDVRGYDPNADAVRALSEGRMPFVEPGLEALLRDGQTSGRLRLTTDSASALRDADLVWITLDTPVDEDDVADPESVLTHASAVLPDARKATTVIVSSQLPVGTTATLRDLFRSAHPDRHIEFAYSPENLRLGRALDAFRRPERIVVGVDGLSARAPIDRVLSRFGPIEWMSIASAEMTKHALNAFLATSVVFMNQVSTICEAVGADAREVERGLKSEGRIGRRAYLAPGAAIGGGTLLRDVGYLARLWRAHRADGVDLFDRVREANVDHALWPERRLRQEMGGALRGRRIAILGLSYKPGTSVIRRSTAIALCRRLVADGADVVAHDPAVRELPPELASVRLAPSPEDALEGAEAVVVATPWPQYHSLSASDLLTRMRRPLVIDPFAALAAAVAGEPRILHRTVGRPR